MANSVWCWFLCLSVKSYVYIYFQVLATQYEGQRYYFERELIEVPDKIYKYKTKASTQEQTLRTTLYIKQLYIYIYWAVFSTAKKSPHCYRTWLCVSIFVTRPVIALFQQLLPAVAAVAAIVAAAVVAQLLVVVVVVIFELVVSGLGPGLLQQCAFN